MSAEYKVEPWEIACKFCGRATQLGVVTMRDGSPACPSEECGARQNEFHDKVDNLNRKFAIEKARLLRPLQEKFNADIFLLEMEYYRDPKDCKS